MRDDEDLAQPAAPGAGADQIVLQAGDERRVRRLEGRRQAEDEHGDRGRQRRHANDVQVDTGRDDDRIGQRREELLQQARGGRREADAGDRAERGEDTAFGQQLSDELPPRGADCQPHRHLTAARHSARHQQACDVRARDQQDDGDHGHYDRDDRDQHLSGGFLADRIDHDVASLVDRVG